MITWKQHAGGHLEATAEDKVVGRVEAFGNQYRVMVPAGPHHIAGNPVKQQHRMFAKSAHPTKEKAVASLAKHLQTEVPTTP